MDGRGKPRIIHATIGISNARILRKSELIKLFIKINEYIWWGISLLTLMITPTINVLFHWREGDWGQALQFVGPSFISEGGLSVWFVLNGWERAPWMLLIMLLLFHTLNKANPGRRNRNDSDTNMGEVGFAISIMILVSLVTMLLAWLTGIYIEGPDFTQLPPGMVWTLMMNAGAWEEIVSRLVLIGFPLWLYHRIRGNKSDPEDLWKGPLRNRPWTPFPIALLVLSSLVFGGLHLSAYGIWKIFPATIGGFVLGWMYLRRGLPTAVLTHCLLDVGAFQIARMAQLNPVVGALIAFLMTGVCLVGLCIGIARMTIRVVESEPISGDE